MNRRRFLELLSIGIGSSAIAYSFPTIIVPKNIVVPAPSLQIFDMRALSAAQKLYVEEGIRIAYEQESLVWSSLAQEGSPLAERLILRGRRVPYNWSDS